VQNAVLVGKQHVHRCCLPVVEVAEEGHVEFSTLVAEVVMDEDTPRSGDQVRRLMA